MYHCITEEASKGHDAPIHNTPATATFDGGVQYSTETLHRIGEASKQITDGHADRYTGGQTKPQTDDE